MNKNAIGLHKFSRIFFGGMMQGLPHAPCRLQRVKCIVCSQQDDFASTRPVQIATKKCNQDAQDKSFASTRPVQIATIVAAGFTSRRRPLPPHAPCRLQLSSRVRRWNCSKLCLHTPRADCNPQTRSPTKGAAKLCLHTPRADCNTPPAAAARSCTSLPPHAPCRLQRQKCTELQYALFRTCVESVDSFSVLNKAMLR